VEGNFSTEWEYKNGYNKSRKASRDSATTAKNIKEYLEPTDENGEQTTGAREYRTLLNCIVLSASVRSKQFGYVKLICAPYTYIRSAMSYDGADVFSRRPSAVRSVFA